MNLLLIDNESSIFEMIERKINNDNYTYIRASGLNEAKEAIKSNIVNLICSDYDYGNGETVIELADFLREENFDIPLVLLSNYSDLINILNRKIDYQYKADFFNKVDEVGDMSEFIVSFLNNNSENCPGSYS